MKKILLVLFAVMLVISASLFTVFADENETVSDATSENSVENNDADDMDVELDFQASGFARNLKYMGLGMLGIFVVVGIVIGLTFVLNAATTKKN